METPEGWHKNKIREVAKIDVGRDLLDERFSKDKCKQYCFPVYSNTVEQFGHYGFYDTPEYTAESVTVVARGIGLGTAFARTQPFGAIGRLLVLSPIGHAFDVNFLADYLNNNFRLFYESGGIPQLPGKTLGSYTVILPPLPEQKQIAGILGTWDKAIATMEALIAASEVQKKALMQQLLTGKRRLPGFEGEWKEVSLIDIAEITTGGSNREDSGLVGAYVFFDRSTDVRRSARFLFDTEAVIVGGEGQEFVPKYYEGKFDLHQRAYAVHTSEKFSIRYLYYIIHYKRHLLRRFAVGSTVASLRMGTFSKIPVPEISLDEQKGIVSILDNNSIEIQALQAKLQALKTEKTALMQQLLTGKRRVKLTEAAA